MDTEFGHTVYIGLSAIILNIAVAVILTLILKAARVPEGTDETQPRQYTADPVDAQIPAPAGPGTASAQRPITTTAPPRRTPGSGRPSS